MWRIRQGLTYANVMATIAVFIALGGAGYAAIRIPANSVGTRELEKNAVTGRNVKDHSLTGADILVSKLGQVPSAAHAAGADLATRAAAADTANSADTANHATTADTAQNASTAGSASSADTANHATTADTAQTANAANTAKSADSAGHATSADSATTADGIAAPEAFHEVGAAGQPAFDPGCHNLGSPYETVAFFKDREGIVHLKGEYNGCSTNNVFTLPAGYRPATGRIQEFFGTNVTVYGPGVTSGYDGQVLCSVGLCSLDGVTFRAAS